MRERDWFSVEVAAREDLAGLGTRSSHRNRI
jgi:hypothetical protein